MKLNHSLTEMDSKPELRSGGKKLRKRRELDALITRSMVRKGYNNQGGVNSQDKLLSASTDDPEDYNFPQVTLSSQTMKRKYLEYRICGPLIILVGVTLSIGFMSWFYFDVRQEIYDYRKKINEVSATSQNLPETLQKWHETTAVLFKNHSSLVLKIHKLQTAMDSLRQNMSDCRELFDAQEKYAKVEKVVADFGAKIESVLSDIEGLKMHYTSIMNNQKLLRDAVKGIKTNLSDVRSLASKAVELPLNYSKEITTLKLTLLREVNLLETNLTIFNDTLSQKSKFLNDELVRHKEKLDGLLDHTENITSHVTSIENTIPVLKKKIGDFRDITQQLETKVADIYNQSKMLDASFKNIYSLRQKQNFASAFNSKVATTEMPVKLSTANLSNIQTAGKGNKDALTTSTP